jgi:hypothetical protein
MVVRIHKYAHTEGGFVNRGNQPSPLTYFTTLSGWVAEAGPK